MHTAETTTAQVLECLEGALAWIDAVPANTVLPAMPGFDRDQVDSIVQRCRRELAQAELSHEELNECWTAVVQFALVADDGQAFLRCWNEGDFDAIRREWPEAPEEVYFADPLAKRHARPRP